jgi:hypothetical protein
MGRECFENGNRGLQETALPQLDVALADRMKDGVTIWKQQTTSPT